MNLIVILCHSVQLKGFLIAFLVRQVFWPQKSLFLKMESLYFSFSFEESQVPRWWSFSVCTLHIPAVLRRLSFLTRSAVDRVFPTPLCEMSAFCMVLLCLLFFFVVQQFEYNMLRCGSYCACPSWNSVELYGYPEYCFYFYRI